MYIYIYIYTHIYGIYDHDLAGQALDLGGGRQVQGLREGVLTDEIGAPDPN